METFWWFCKRRQYVDERRNGDAGKEIIQAFSLMEAINQMKSIQEKLRQNGGTMWLKLSHGIYGPFTTKERAERFKTSQKLRPRKLLARIQVLGEKDKML